MAISMQRAKLNIYFGWIDKIPGIPPTPTAFAVVLVATHTIAAQAEPIIPHTNGKLYFKFTPKMAGSVTPK